MCTWVHILGVDMGKPKLDRVGRWSEVKLDILRDYAREYTKILSQQSSIRRFVYVDAFAGAGEHISKTTGERIPGSPLLALDVQPSFHEFHFIDLDELRVAKLEQLATGRRDVHVYHGDCNEVLLNRVLPRCRWEDFHRALCLLDPYKLAVDWHVLKTAGQMRSVEVFYNFMVMDLNMNMLLRNPDKASPAQLDRLNRVWGDETWRDVLYKRSPGLFPDIEIQEKESNDRVAEAFRQRLQKVAGFKYVPKPVAMKNSSGAVVYYLYFASPNPTGHKIVNHIFRKYAG